VVDDGSTDESRAVARRFDRVILVEKSNGGLPTALNAGLRRATGQIVCWLDSDNLLLPGAVAEAVACFRKSPHASIVYGDYSVIDELDRVVRVRRQPSFDYRICLYGYLTICNAAVFFNGAMLDAAGGADESIGCACDMDLYLRMARLGPVIHLRRFLGAYRSRPDAMHVSQASREREEMWRNRIRHSGGGLSMNQLRLRHAWYKARAAVRMLREGALWCRVWPFGRLAVLRHQMD
jgi:glycosyltransferase involved in cell wall biosynthesis